MKINFKNVSLSCCHQPTNQGSFIIVGSLFCQDLKAGIIEYTHLCPPDATIFLNFLPNDCTWRQTLQGGDGVASRLRTQTRRRRFFVRRTSSMSTSSTQTLYFCVASKRVRAYAFFCRKSESPRTQKNYFLSQGNETSIRFKTSDRSEANGRTEAENLIFFVGKRNIFLYFGA